MTIYREIPQKSQQWFELRRGRVCSSQVAGIVDGDGLLRRGRTKSATYSDGVKGYVAKLVAERVSGYSAIEGEYQSSAMMYGVAYEHAARAALELHVGVGFESIGGVLSDCGRWWASSDGVAMDGDKIVAVAEIKIPTPKTQVSYLLDESALIDEYKPQLCHEMLVTGAEHGFLFSYGAGINAKRVNVLSEVDKSDPFIAALRESLEIFDMLVMDALRRIGADTTPPVAVKVETNREWFERQFGTPAGVTP